MYSTWRKFDITQNNQPFDVVINVEDKTDHLKSTHLYPLFTKTFINFCPFPEPQLGNICVSIKKTLIASTENNRQLCDQFKKEVGVS